MPYEIPFQDKGLDQLNKKLEATAGNVDKLIAKTKELNASTAKGGAAARSYIGPFSAVENARSMLSDAQAGGATAQRIKDLEYRLKRAESAAARADKVLNPVSKTQDERMMDVLMTSRLNLGGISPLVGKLHGAGLLDGGGLLGLISSGAHTSTGAGATANTSTGLSGRVMGMAGSMAPMVAELAIPAAIAAAGALGIAKVVDAANSTVKDRAGAYYGAGATGSEVGKLDLLGRVMGMSASQAGDRAVAFGDAVRGGGYGAAYFRARGIVDKGIYTTDKASNYLKAIDELRNIKTDAEAVMVARSTGLTPELGFRDMSEAAYKGIRNEMAFGQTKGERQNKADYDATAARAGANLDRFWRMITGPINTLLAGPQLDYSDSDTDKMYNFLHGDSQTPSWSAGGKNSKEAIEKNTEAIAKMTRVMADHAEMLGSYGPRAQAAVPAGWKLNMMDEALTSQAQMLGAFTAV